MNLPDRKKALEAAIAYIEKQFGSGSIMSLGKHLASHEISTIRTGALSLDLALGIGGVPKGRIVEIFGPESSGKTTLATHIVANAQKWEALPHILMLSMLLILAMLLLSVRILTIS